jgi:hypothetical protein
MGCTPLGRSSVERRKVLDAIKEELPKRGYVLVIFDFQEPTSRDTTETVSTLAHMPRFIIPNIADPGFLAQNNPV